MMTTKYLEAKEGDVEGERRFMHIDGVLACAAGYVNDPALVGYKANAAAKNAAPRQHKMAPAFADANQFNGPRHSFFLLLQNLQQQVIFYLIILVCVAYAPLGKTGSLPLWEPHQSLLLSLDGVWPTVLTPFKAEHASEYVSRNISQCAEPTGSYLRFIVSSLPQLLGN